MFYDTIHIQNRVPGGIWWTHEFKRNSIIEILHRIWNGEPIEQESVIES